MSKSKNVESSTIKLRSDRNRNLIQRMKDGEELNQFDAQASWFPPRPIIKKDKNAISKLYGSGNTLSAAAPRKATKPS